MRDGYTISRAAQVAGVTYGTVLGWRHDDPEFARRFDEAVIEGNGRLEDEAVRRAVEGVDRPVFGRVGQVGVVTEYSDRLLEFLMRGRIDKFKERRDVSLRTPDGGMTINQKMQSATPEEAAQLYRDFVSGDDSV